MRTVGEVIEAVAASNLKPGRYDLLSFNDPLGSNDFARPTYPSAAPDEQIHRQLTI